MLVIKWLLIRPVGLGFHGYTNHEIFKLFSANLFLVLDCIAANKTTKIKENCSAKLAHNFIFDMNFYCTDIVFLKLRLVSKGAKTILWLVAEQLSTFYDTRNSLTEMQAVDFIAAHKMPLKIR